jgi:hypothetical protein
MLIATFGFVQLMVKPFDVLGVTVMVGTEVLDTTATVCEVVQPVMVFKKVAV